MSLLLMDTNTFRPRASSTSSWRSAFSRKGSRSPQPDKQPTTASPGLLSPAEPLRRRSSSASRSSSSFTTLSEYRKKWFRVFNVGRPRTSSTASATDAIDGPLDETDFRKVQGWIDAFSKYNRLITNQVSVDSSFPQKQLAKIQEQLTHLNDGIFISDLPAALFDIALLWCPAGHMTRKSAEHNEPSWSWRGWNGAVNFPFDPSTCPDVREDAEDIFFESKIRTFTLGPSSGPHRYTIRNRDQNSKHPRPRIQHVSKLLPSLLGEKHPEVESDTLRFTTTKIPATVFKREQIINEADQQLLCCGLMDSKGHPCGVVMDYDEKISAYKPEENLYFILLSVSRRVESSWRTPRTNVEHPSGIPIWQAGKFRHDQEISDPDPEHYEAGEWKMYNVMLIQEFDEQRSEDGTVTREAYAERVAIGRIHEDAWKTAEPSKADIVLR